MISISIDASTTMIGYSIWDEDELIKYGKLAPTIKDLEWRERVKDFIPQLQTIINEYKPKKMYAEDVPLFEKGQGAKGKKTLVQLGATQGSIIGLCGANNIEIEFIPVSTWRSNIGLYNGTEEGKERDNLKIASIIKANELFGIDLKCLYTRNGTYKSKGSDDDIADSILVYASTRDKYKIKSKSFGRK